MLTRYYKCGLFDCDLPLTMTNHWSLGKITNKQWLNTYFNQTLDTSLIHLRRQRFPTTNCWIRAMWWISGHNNNYYYLETDIVVVRTDVISRSRLTTYIIITVCCIHGQQTIECGCFFVGKILIRTIILSFSGGECMNQSKNLAAFAMPMTITIQVLYWWSLAMHPTPSPFPWNLIAYL